MSLLKTVISDADNGVFSFDGKSVAHDVTDEVSFGADGLASRFTVATWLKHEEGDDEEVKQHVLCSADAEGRFTRPHHETRVVCFMCSLCVCGMKWNDEKDWQ